ncbi:unnamed protein product [Protopolystoma xenopodis]|uniref:Uncharacterized protein n=1 Tax=Protopolystoma xenopodis TaxID=117903 RepID=A0A3S5C7Q3_9PLAT|nr:unnamed protein product [Protopolystoma xenopodis]
MNSSCMHAQQRPPCCLGLVISVVHVNRVHIYDCVCINPQASANYRLVWSAQPPGRYTFSHHLPLAYRILLIGAPVRLVYLICFVHYCSPVCSIVSNPLARPIDRLAAPGEAKTLLMHSPSSLRFVRLCQVDRQALASFDQHRLGA